MKKLFAQITTRSLALLLLSFPLFFISSGLKEIHTGKKLRNKGIVTKASVLSVNTRVSTDDDGDDTYYYTPTIEFQADDGLIYKKKLKETTHPYRAKGEIEVIYFRDDPNSVQHNHYKSLFGGGIGTIIVTIIAMIVLISMYVGWNKK